VISTVVVGGVTYYYANNAFQTVYGGDNWAVVSPAVNGTDCAAVWQAALNDGGKIAVKRGVYPIDTLLTGDLNNLFISGEASGFSKYGDSGVILVATAAIDSILKLNSADDVDIISFAVENIEFDGDNLATNGLTVIAGYENSFNNIKIRDCTVGLNLLGPSKSLFSMIRVDNCVTDLYMGISPVRTINCNDLTFLKCDFIQGSEYGVHGVLTGGLSLGGEAHFIRCTIESNQKRGAYFEDFKGVTFDNCHFENNDITSTAGIDDLFIEGSERVTIKDTYFLSTLSRNSIFVGTTNVVSIDNNLLNRDLTMDTVKYVTMGPHQLFNGLNLLDVDNGKFDTVYCGPISVDVDCSYLTFDTCHFDSTKSFLGDHLKFINCKNYVTESNGDAVGNNAEQTIAHGCDFTPGYDDVVLSERHTGGALAFQSNAPDATNIYVTATNAKDYNWRVIGRHYP
jgi:hypothetical protein